MTQNEIEEVVRGLTPAMRDALTWPTAMPAGVLVCWHFYSGTIRGLERRGLVDKAHRFTPLGLAVRNHLSQTKEAERGA